MRIAAACAFALVLACGASAHGGNGCIHATVGFALTGNDNVEPKVIGNRASCVFAINNDLFRLDNVHTDRITIQGEQRQRPSGLEQWVTSDGMATA
jgi:hypothetical protein